VNRLIRAIDVHADGVIGRAIAGTRCHHCRKAIRTSRYRVVIHPVWGPVSLHPRCIHPVRRTRRADVLIYGGLLFATGGLFAALIIMQVPA
jgi:hypothetical protein